MTKNIEDLDLLDKALDYKIKIDNMSEAQTKFAYYFLAFLSIICILFGVYYFFESQDLFMCMFFILLGIIGTLFSIRYPKHFIQKMEDKILEIENLTVEYEKFEIETQVVSKNHDSNPSAPISYRYAVGLRTHNGKSLVINSRNLFLAIREGEYINVLILQKIDADGNLLDSSHVPLMKTIRTTL